MHHPREILPGYRGNLKESRVVINQRDLTFFYILCIGYEALSNKNLGMISKEKRER